MSDLFADNNASSARAWASALRALQLAGQATIDGLAADRIGLLLGFEQPLSALNAKRTRAHRRRGVDTAAQFLVSDLTAIVQPETTASVRIDGPAVTLAKIV